MAFLKQFQCPPNSPLSLGILGNSHHAWRILTLHMRNCFSWWIMPLLSSTEQREPLKVNLKNCKLSQCPLFKKKIKFMRSLLNELFVDPEIEKAVRTAVLLSGSPPDSPHQEAKGLNSEGSNHNFSKNVDSGGHESDIPSSVGFSTFRYFRLRKLCDNWLWIDYIIEVSLIRMLKMLKNFLRQTSSKLLKVLLA